ncbi:MAG: non-heme iron oxygenase ferredoxin subunit [Oxalobacteraceae bacterium]|jgi:3-phenylpropionate/trans-cinnamate dioxygenase ferredoxin subunit|nr:non-heme iron oxygenase ferredoxin subunit [uncultured Noviherbaspirillum sp.]RYE78814.1 MAG: non-heme iron oxygenase ferredoxin subunit [Oxalobacteraceae bacterium]
MAWTRVAAADDVAEGEVVGVTAAGQQIALYRDKGEFFATSNVCTHQYALLSDGYFEDGCIECPLHQGSFDVRTGKAQCAPVTEDIKVYPLRVEGDDLLADI